MKSRIHRIVNMLRPHDKQKSYALNELDIRLRSHIDFRKGFFVEVGANDGIRQSNTLYFERYLGWMGILIEAIPSLAKQCKINRPRCIVENLALVAADYPNDIVEMQYCNLMSIVKGATGDVEKDEQHIRSGMRFLKEEEKTYTVEVPARTLSWVLDKNNIDQIDLLSLDVEGYELQVLKGIDFERHRPKHMLIEVHDQNAIEAVIGSFYKLIAVLHVDKSYSDILYQSAK